MRKKVVVLGIVLIFLTTSLIFNNKEQYDKNTQKSKILSSSNGIHQETFVFGIRTFPQDIDPHSASGHNSFNVINQVCERLYAYNTSDPGLEILPQLASDFGIWEINPDGTANYTISLKSGILFHDGMPFNATAVKWSFDRLKYFIENGFCPFVDIYRYYDTDSSSFKYIINRTEVLNENTIRFILNKPYVVFEGLLTFSGSSILSPLSTPPTEEIDIATGELVSTGPFVYDGNEFGVEIVFHAFEQYWNGKADIEEMVFSVISDTILRRQALLNGDVHFLDNIDSSNIPLFEADPNVVLIDEGKTDFTIRYLGMNNNQINSTFREAISTAINYSYILDELLEGRGKRLKSPIPEGWPYADDSLQVAIYNLSHARYIMTTMGFGVGFTTDAQWQAATFATFNYTYVTTNTFTSKIFPLLKVNLSLIGIDVVDAGVSSIDWLNRLLEIGGYTRDYLQLYWTGWIVEYLDPNIILNPLFTNRTRSYNDCQYNGYLSAMEAGRDPFDVFDNVQLLMEAAWIETDGMAKNAMYQRIQQLLVEEDMPWAFGFVRNLTHAHSVELTGFHQNGLNILYFYSCNWSKYYPNVDIYIDDINPKFNWSKTALENDWCTGSGTWEDPYIIQDLIFDNQSKLGYIYIENSNVYFQVKNCTFYGSLNGITLLNVNNSQIFNNTLWGSDLISQHGIRLSLSNNNTVYDCSINGTQFGIQLMESNYSRIFENNIQNCSFCGIASMSSSYNLIADNYLLRNNYGIFDTDGFNITIRENTVDGSLFYGIGASVSKNDTIIRNIVVRSEYMAITLYSSNNTLIQYNNLSNNIGYGMGIYGSIYGESDNNQVSYNKISDNTDIGIALNNITSNNLFFNNELLNNSLNAQDNGILNLWDNGAIGNSWDDYLGTDVDDDGIGDVPYSIDGEANSFDNYPIFDDGPDEIPVISIYNPENDDVFGKNAPPFNILIETYNLDSSWYTLDGGITNISITGFTGTINQDEWNKFNSETITIRFYANNSKGFLGFSEITVYKDITDPEITVNNPEVGETFEASPPIYDITVNEENLDTIWYTLDDGATNITISENTGIIDETAWDSQPNGYITIRFYANDTLGNVGASSPVIITKDAPQTPPGNIFAIFLLFIIIGAAAAIGVILFLLYRKFRT
ncbi:MAG: right-handed parallel beta-helix repeat-containing protein [Candidatus Lokiarchaeota archaeon]|nr:right-handed parallel beta-helix repeat-containing protein [Candidatus Lokiarchaeota archaeon]